MAFENNPFISTLQAALKNPKYVFVNEKNLKILALDLAKQSLEIPAWRIKHVYPESDDERIVEHLGWLNSLNFAFTNFNPPHFKYSIEYPQGKIWEGTLALAAALMKSFDTSDFNIAKRMANLTYVEGQDIFKGIYPIPLLAERIAILREVGAALLEKFDGKWINLFEASNWKVFNKGDGIVELLLSNFPSFHDESLHSATNSILKFQKRAQLMALMYQGRALNSNRRLPLLKDADDIGPIADYSVPKVLRNLGILRYSYQLEREIKERLIIPKDSLKEQEIRAQMSYVMVKLVEEINKYRKPKDRINMINLDYKIWSLKNRYKDFPHHLTPTTNY